METATATPATQQIPVDKIVPSPFQARKNFDEQSLKELAQTIKDRGLQQPIIVRETLSVKRESDQGSGPTNDASQDTIYELIAGERRWRAVKQLGWQTIEAKVEAVDDKEAALKGVVENAQREDLNPIEQAQVYQKLANAPFNLNHEDIASMIGKDRSLVTKYLSLNQLGDGNPEKCESFTKLGLGQLLELARVQNAEDQASLALEAEKKDLSVIQIRALVDQKVGPKKAKATPHHSPNQDTASPADPMAAVWEKVRPGTVAWAAWEVSYGLDGAWTFKIKPKSDSASFALVGWCENMAKLINDFKGLEKSNTNETQMAQNAPATESMSSAPQVPSHASADQPVAEVASPESSDVLQEGAKQLVTDVAKNLLSNLF